MATVNPQFTSHGDNFMEILWETVATGDTCTPVKMERFSGLGAFFDVRGTFANGTTVTLEGGADGTNTSGLSDTQGTAISHTAAGISELSTGALYVAPVVASGSADDVDIRLIVAKL